MNQTASFINRTYSSEGFVIGRKKFGEADRILVLFTKDFGKISLIAKGVRKLTSRKRGGIEIFSYVRFSAIKGRSLDMLSEVQVVDSFEKIRRNLNKVSLGYYFCEVIGRITREDEKHSEVFDIVKEALVSLGTQKQLKRLRLEFVRDVITCLGFWPKGRRMDNPDAVLESITERKMNSVRVGKKMLQQN